MASNFQKPSFLSDKQFQEHIKLYEGYVKKSAEIGEKLKASTFEDANATFSEVRSLRRGETFAANGIRLHEHYFQNLAKKETTPKGKLFKEIVKKWGSFDKFQKAFVASALSVRGWVILAYDWELERFKIYATDQHDNAVWSATPLLVLDVYEHAYFMDFGANRKAYVEAFMKNINWNFADECLEYIR
ncbi:MAG: superoxide dismutase [DPANN group archaeon]|nr:superoxide dismutase [DPANN group archaeon]